MNCSNEPTCLIAKERNKMQTAKELYEDLASEHSVLKKEYEKLKQSYGDSERRCRNISSNYHDLSEKVENNCRCCNRSKECLAAHQDDDIFSCAFFYDRPKES